MNNYEERLGHKRVRMEGELVQGNGLPLSYMDNGHQIPYQPYAGSYNAHYPPAELAGGGFGAYAPAAELGYASRGLGYAPPAHQTYSFVQQQQQQQQQPQQQQPAHHAPPQMLHYDQHHAHVQHKPAWPPQPLMQPLQSNEQLKVKQEIKAEPSAVPLDSAGPSVISMRPTIESHVTNVETDSSGSGNPLNEDAPKIKIKTDIFKESEATNPNRRGVIADGSADVDKSNPECDPAKLRQPGIGDSGNEAMKNINENSNAMKDSSMDMLGGNPGGMDLEGVKSRISDSGNSTDSANKNKFQGFSDSESSSSSEDETKIPNEIYFGTPDISTYRPRVITTPASTSLMAQRTPGTPGIAGTPEVKKRGRPKGSCNKPKPPGMLPGTPRPQAVGRPRGGGGHSASFYPHTMRPFKRDFSGIRFKRRWSDDGLDSSHIPNEVYFGDYPVSMEILFNYYDANAEKHHHHHHHHKSSHQTPGNVTLVNSSSDSSSDDSSDSDTTDDENAPMMTPMKRGPGRPRGSKTINRRSDGQRLSSSPGDKPPGITEMKRFLKIAGIEYDYTKLIEGCLSNKERVAALLGLLEAKGLKGPPTVEACRALYTGPPPRRRGPKPGTKRTPKTSIATSTEQDPPSPKTTPVPGDEELRRITRGQTSGKPRQRIVISSDEEDAHTPLSKLRTMR